MLLSAQPRGATLIELVIAITTVGLVLVSFLTLTVSNFRSQEVDRENMVGSQLAREGIEVVRSIRDTNFMDRSFDATPWDGILDGLDDTGTVSVADRAIDFSADSLDDGNLYWQPDGTISHQVSDDDSGYDRLITVYPVCTDDVTAVSPDGSCSADAAVGAVVTSTVRWWQDGQPRSLDLQTTLYGWR